MVLFPYIKCSHVCISPRSCGCAGIYSVRSQKVDVAYGIQEKAHFISMVLVLLSEDMHKVQPVVIITLTRYWKIVTMVVPLHW